MEFVESSKDVWSSFGIDWGLSWGLVSFLGVLWSSFWVLCGTCDVPFGGPWGSQGVLGEEPKGIEHIVRLNSVFLCCVWYVSCAFCSPNKPSFRGSRRVVRRLIPYLEAASVRGNWFLSPAGFPWPPVERTIYVYIYIYIYSSTNFKHESETKNRMVKCFEHKTTFLDTHRHFRLATDYSRFVPIVCGV